MRISVLFLVAVALVAHGADSPKAPVSPSIDKTGAKQDAAKPKNDQRPTEIVAPLFITTTHPPEPTKAAPEHAEKESQAREDWTTHFVRFTLTDFAIALFTGMLCIFAYWQLRSLGVTADAAKEAADIAEATLVTTNRPWLTVGLKIAGSIQVLSINNADGSITKRVLVPTILTVNCNGNSPAIDVRPFWEVSVPRVTGTVEFQKIIREKTVTFEQAMARGDHEGIHGMLLPKDSISFPWVASKILPVDVDLREETILIVCGVRYAFTFGDPKQIRISTITYVVEKTANDTNTESMLNPLSMTLSAEHRHFT